MEFRLELINDAIKNVLLKFHSISDSSCWYFQFSQHQFVNTFTEMITYSHLNSGKCFNGVWTSFWPSIPFIEHHTLGKKEKSSQLFLWGGKKNLTLEKPCSCFLQTSKCTVGVHINVHTHMQTKRFNQKYF